MPVKSDASIGEDLHLVEHGKAAARLNGYAVERVVCVALDVAVDEEVAR